MIQTTTQTLYAILTAGEDPDVHLCTSPEEAAMWISAQVLYRDWGIIHDNAAVKIHHGGQLGDILGTFDGQAYIFVAGDPPQWRFKVKMIEISQSKKVDIASF